MKGLLFYRPVPRWASDWLGGLELRVREFHASLLSFRRSRSLSSRVMFEDVWFNYRFCVQTVRVGGKRRYQLRIGLSGDADDELVPVHRSAFAKHLRLKVTHPSEEAAQAEFTELIAWLNSRTEARIIAQLAA